MVPRSSERARRESITVSYEARERLLAEPQDATLAPGAKNAIRACLDVRGGESLVLVAEVGLEPVAAALLREALAAGAAVDPYVVSQLQAINEPFAARLEGKLAEADASILACSDALAPSFRRRLVSAPGPRRRHAQMVGITASMMSQAMRADYAEVEALGARLASRLGRAGSIEVVGGPRTRFVVHTTAAHRWHNGSGILRRPGWTALPGGELTTTPASLDGTVVPDGGLFLPDGRVLGRGQRLRLTFEDGYLKEAEGPGAEELLDVVDVAPHGRRVGRIGFGTNTSVLTPIGSPLQDTKMPGLHLVLGFPCPELHGASWTSTIEVPLLVRRPDVRVDGRPVLVRGRYARDLLP